MSENINRLRQEERTKILDSIGTLSIRQAISEDYPLIFNSWLKSAQKSNFSRNIHASVYFPNHHKIIDDILQRAKTLVAVDPNDASHIFGFIVAEKVEGVCVFHYIYIKHLYRDVGIGQQLLNAMCEILGHSVEVASFCSHLPNYKIANSADRRNFIYNPYLMYPTDWKKTPTLLPPSKPPRGNG